MNLRRQPKLLYYLQAYARYARPSISWERRLLQLERRLNAEDLAKAEERIGYYCQGVRVAPEAEHTVGDLRRPISPKNYYLDTYEYARYFPPSQPVDWVFGDVIHIPQRPSLVKSRPVGFGNEHSVLLNLDKNRHFVFVENDRPFEQKKDLMIGRGAVTQPHRMAFFERWFGHPLADLGQVNARGGRPEVWLKPKISIREHLDYKFILSLEGNDVATNLKWIMSSNSLAVMPRPKFETWFMEGRLVGGKHYIEICEDYSDLESQLRFYMAHPEKCLEIIGNAHRHIGQFQDQTLEAYISLKVLQTYFGLV